MYYYENATPVKLGCTSKWYVDWRLAEPDKDGKTVLMKLKEKGATEESIQNAVEQVTVTGSTLLLGQKSSMLCLIESEKKVQIGSVLMNDTGVSWSVRNDDTEYDTEIQYWKIRIERPKEAQAKSTKTDQVLEWFCIPRVPKFVEVQEDPHRKWQVCACRKLNGEIRLVLQECTSDGNGNGNGNCKKMLRPINCINWASFTDQQEFFLPENWWHLVCAKLLAKYGIAVHDPKRDLNDLPLRSQYSKDESTLAELKGEVKLDWNQHVIPAMVKMYDRSQCWPSQVQKKREIQANSDVKMARRIHAIEEEKKTADENGIH